jgi:hypothetical protein
VRTGAGLAAIVAASVLVLTGCSTARPVPLKPTASEIRVFTERVATIELATGELKYDETTAIQTAGGALSQGLGNEGKLQPFSVSLSGEKNVDRQMRYEDCMVASGYPLGAEYVDIGHSRNATDFFFSVTEQGEEVQCHRDAGSFESPPDPYSGLLGAKQRAYVYEYYVQWLVPCLSTRGQFLKNAPTKDQFTAAWQSSGWWTPYEVLMSRPSAAELAKLEGECPPMPAGFS